VLSLRECLRTVTPAMLVVLSWTYVFLANINMVRQFIHISHPHTAFSQQIHSTFVLLMASEHTGTNK
jgi:hypothetical protein